MTKKVYISGKITGLQDLNIKKFNEAEAKLRSNGFAPVNPHKILPFHPNRTWEEYMKADIKELMTCDIIAVLDDWKESKGAIVEVKMALTVGMPLMCAHTLEVLESHEEPIDNTKKIPTKHILKEIKRELEMRIKLYPNWIRFDKIKKEEAEHRVKVMQQVYNDYKDLLHIGQAKQSEVQGNLF